MALWQFTVIAVLMGALLVHTSFLTLRIGRANAALKRIEDALLAKVEAVTPAPVAPVEATPPLELTDMEDSAARYLTIRDLKVRSEQRRSQVTASLERPAAPDMSGKFASLLFGRDKSEDTPLVSSVPVSSESSDAPNINTEASTETPSLPASQPEIGNSASVENENAMALSSESLMALSLETRALSDSIEALSTSIEPPLHASQSENENSVAASSETRDAPNASTEPQHSPASPTVTEDTVEQREREALLFQSNQRRRRRARQGY